MADRGMLQRLAALEALLRQIHQGVHSGVLQRMDEQVGGLRATRFDAPVRGAGRADPTQSLAMSQRDLALVHLAEFDHAVLDALGALRRAAELVSLYPPPRVADAADRAALERINGRQPGCQNCAQLIMDSGAQRWEPIDSAMSDATTVGGILDEALLLCQWCRKRTAAWKRLPTIAELERHHRGERVAWPRDVPRPS